SRRKGVFRMVEALHRVEPETARKAEFRFLGKAAVRDRVAFANALLRLRRRRPDVRVSFDDRAVPEQELREAMADADWILMPYLRPEYSSGILARAVAAGTPALGPAEGLIGRLILESGLGRVTRMDPVSLGRSLDEAAAAPGRIEESRRATFLDRSRPDVFAKSLLRAGWLDG
ncbi:MAG: hypothetical protein U1E27_08245, partial [Kiritimatiellia bacterium]|nr:hypothetical protein [Kiritimatiellia bacterium]